MRGGGGCAGPAFGPAPFLLGGVGAAKGLLPCFLVPKGNQPTACTLALWWLKFGPTEDMGGGGGGPNLNQFCGQTSTEALGNGGAHSTRPVRRAQKPFPKQLQLEARPQAPHFSWALQHSSGSFSVLRKALQAQRQPPAVNRHFRAAAGPILSAVSRPDCRQWRLRNDPSSLSCLLHRTPPP